jgi:hypothetical protein
MNASALPERYVVIVSMKAPSGTNPGIRVFQYGTFLARSAMIEASLANRAPHNDGNLSSRRAFEGETSPLISLLCRNARSGIERRLAGPCGDGEVGGGVVAGGVVVAGTVAGVVVWLTAGWGSDWWAGRSSH